MDEHLLKAKQVRRSSNLATSASTQSASTKLAACIPQGHMNKDHADDTKLIVQHSTSVKASGQARLIFSGSTVSEREREAQAQAHNRISLGRRRRSPPPPSRSPLVLGHRRWALTRGGRRWSSFSPSRRGHRPSRLPCRGAVEPTRTRRPPPLRSPEDLLPPPDALLSSGPSRSTAPRPGRGLVELKMKRNGDIKSFFRNYEAKTRKVAAEEQPEPDIDPPPVHSDAEIGIDIDPPPVYSDAEIDIDIDDEAPQQPSPQHPHARL
ncbi:serine/arginine repetitive matrix protein 1-like [Triticum dicoccoides]|uniref:serine/arginine repetitive matrix protein 1-like n=1 Tax=Triticum dicoccoides TaxID=85692 RepID=UPI0018917461|nr:serine/arginine repetitive matrix protein 1-like [Triticum dicoccoides]